MEDLVSSKFNLKNKLQTLKDSGSFRKTPVSSSKDDKHITIDGITYLNFAANDYLGLANHPKIITALKNGADKFGVGTGASPLVTGKTKVHQELEERLANITQKEAVLLFSTGFSANQALIKAFINLKADLILDKLVHASMQDAASTYNSFKRYPHNNIEKASTLLQNTNKGVLFTEGVFSMDGDISNLNEISKICKASNSPLVVDDAHAFGVLGHLGHGTPEYCNLKPNDVNVYMATLSKAVGVQGAFIAGSKDFIDYLINTSREYIYSTYAPAALANATLTSLDIIETEGVALRKHLSDMVALFKELLVKETSYTPSDSITSIQPIIIGSNEDLLNVASHLRKKEIYVGAIRPPTVPVNTARLRITITASHNEDDIKNLVAGLASSQRNE